MHAAHQHGTPTSPYLSSQPGLIISSAEMLAGESCSGSYVPVMPPSLYLKDKILYGRHIDYWRAQENHCYLHFPPFLNKARLQLIVLFTVEVAEESFAPYSPLNLFFSYSCSPPPLQAFNKPQEYKSEKNPKISLLMNCLEKVSTRLVLTVQISDLFISWIIGD